MTAAHHAQPQVDESWSTAGEPSRCEPDSPAFTETVGAAEYLLFVEPRAFWSLGRGKGNEWMLASYSPSH